MSEKQRSEEQRPTEKPSAYCVDPDGFFNRYGIHFAREDDPPVSDAEINSAIRKYDQTQLLTVLPTIRLSS